MSYIILVILCVLAGISAADETDPEDLGIIDAQIGIQLHQDTSSKEWRAFYAEFFPLETYKTNMIPMLFTNTIVKASDLEELPSGKIRLDLYSIYGDGSKSDPVHYRFALKKEKPPAPSASRIFILPQPEFLTNGTTTVDKFRLPRVTTNDLPPLPPTTLIISIPPPLPNATNKTYSEHMAEVANMVKFYYDQAGKRRNQ